MNVRDPYEAWKLKRTSISPAPGFADRVMNRIRLQGRQVRDRSAGDARSRLTSLRYATAAAILVGLAAGLARAVWLVAFLLATPGKGT
jgi:hypothetical protein